MTDPTYILLTLFLLMGVAGWIVARYNWLLSPHQRAFQRTIRVIMVRVTADIRELNAALDHTSQVFRAAGIQASGFSASINAAIKEEERKALEQKAKGPQ